LRPVWCRRTLCLARAAPKSSLRMTSSPTRPVSSLSWGRVQPRCAAGRRWCPGTGSQSGKKSRPAGRRNWKRAMLTGRGEPFVYRGCVQGLAEGVGGEDV
jgi:hypothetical protein